MACTTAKTDHIQSEDKSDAAFDALDTKIETRFSALGAKIDSIEDAITMWRLETRKRRMLYNVWRLMIAGAILSVIARGMKWI